MAILPGLLAFVLLAPASAGATCQDPALQSYIEDFWDAPFVPARLSRPEIRAIQMALSYDHDYIQPEGEWGHWSAQDEAILQEVMCAEANGAQCDISMGAVANWLLPYSRKSYAARPPLFSPLSNYMLASLCAEDRD